MSLEALNEIWLRNRSRASSYVDRCVLTAIAVHAGKDGIAWPSQTEIAAKAGENCTERQVRRSIENLERLGDLEVRKAQRGRARINVYRVRVGRIGEREVDYTQLPFTVDEPFSRPDTVSARRADGRHEPVPRAEPPGTGDTPDERTERPAVETVTTGHSGRDDRTDERTAERARVDGSFGAEPEEPSKEPTLTRAAGGREQEQIDEALFEQLGFRPRTRSEHGAWAKAVAELIEANATVEQIRERCARYRERWPGVTLTPSALVKHWSLLGEQPSPWEIAAERSRLSKRAWIENTSWRLDEDEVRHTIDGWDDIDDVERSLLRDYADEIRAQHTEPRVVDGKADAA